MLMHNLKQIFIALDQLLACILCTLFNEMAYADMSLSSMAHRWHLRGMRSWPRAILNFFFFWQSDHCFMSYEKELSREHFPDDMR